MEKIAKFKANDPFLLSEQLTEEERMIADSARAYARKNLLPRVTDMFINESDAPEIFTEMGAQGLLGVTIKQEYGGAGASYVSYGLVAREVEAIDSGYRSMMSVQSSLVMHPINTFGSEEQKQEHPFGKVPAIRDADLHLYETLAICIYIDEEYTSDPQLQPRDVAVDPRLRVGGRQLDAHVLGIALDGDGHLGRVHQVQEALEPLLRRSLGKGGQVRRLLLLALALALLELGLLALLLPLRGLLAAHAGVALPRQRGR